MNGIVYTQNIQQEFGQNEQEQMVQMFCLEVTIKGNIYDPVNNYSYVEDTKVSVSIKKTNANKCTLSEIFLSEAFKHFSAFYSGCLALEVNLNEC